MGIVPENTRPRIDWYRSHLAPWAEHFDEIGVSEEQVAALEVKVAAAAEMFKQQQIAQNEAKAATQRLHRAMEELSQLGGSMIGQIKSKARMEGDAIFTKASMPKPAEPSPIPAPGTPTDFKAILGSQGEIELTWTCSNPKGSEGTMYEIHRRIGDGPNVPLGAVGRKRFVDETIPAGTTFAMYSVRAFRSTRRGAVATFNVYLGIGDGYIPQQRREPKAKEKGTPLTVRAA